MKDDDLVFFGMNYPASDFERGRFVQADLDTLKKMVREARRLAEHMRSYVIALQKETGELYFRSSEILKELPWEPDERSESGEEEK